MCCLTVLVSQEFRCHLSGCLWLRFSHEVVVRLLSGAVVAQAWWALGFTSKLVHTCGFGQEDSALHHVGPSTETLGLPQHLAVGQVADLREGARGSSSGFQTPISNITNGQTLKPHLRSSHWRRAAKDYA